MKMDDINWNYTELSASQDQSWVKSVKNNNIDEINYYCYKISGLESEILEESKKLIPILMENEIKHLVWINKHEEYTNAHLYMLVYEYPEFKENFKHLTQNPNGFSAFDFKTDGYVNPYQGIYYASK